MRELFVLTQFLGSGCENCAFFGMDGDRERVADCTTPNFQSLLSVVDPASSWTAKWQHLSEFPFTDNSTVKLNLNNSPSMLSVVDPASSSTARRQHLCYFCESVLNGLYPRRRNERVVKGFRSLLSVADPAFSWIANWQRPSDGYIT